MNKIISKIVVVAVIFFTAPAVKSQVNDAGPEAFKKITKIGPEGCPALYWWNPQGYCGLGCWQLASDSSTEKMMMQQIVPEKSREVKINGDTTIKIITLTVSGFSNEFFFDGYWRKYPQYCVELNQ